MRPPRPRQPRVLHASELPSVGGGSIFTPFLELMSSTTKEPVKQDYIKVRLDDIVISS